jgi:hypothetical protein
VVAQHKASLLNVPDEVQTEQCISQPHGPINISQPVIEEGQSLYIEDPTVIDRLPIPQLKAQLEMYRLQVDIVPKKSEINKLKKQGLVDLLRMVVAKYKASGAEDFPRNLHTTHAEGYIMREEASARMEVYLKSGAPKLTRLC